MKLSSNDNIVVAILFLIAKISIDKIRSITDSTVRITYCVDKILINLISYHVDKWTKHCLILMKYSSEIDSYSEMMPR